MKFVSPSELESFPPPRELTPEQLAEALAAYKAQFTAADLQYTEELTGEPMEEVIQQLEEHCHQVREQTP